MTINFAVIVPTLNAGQPWQAWLQAVKIQTVEPSVVIVLDSESNDSTAESARAAGCVVVTVPRENFDHGGTRQSALLHIPERTEFLVYLTQDAILAACDAFEKILAPFADQNVGVAYGRQLPRPDAAPVEAHARLFNYPVESYTRVYADKAKFGMRVIFCSNSFAAYRKTALIDAGGFPSPVLFSEDQIAAAHMLRAGHKICYVSDALVFHSHEYTVGAEFRRYFDIGANHHRYQWLLREFGRPEGHGADFVRSELRYLLRKSPRLVPVALVRTVAKYFGYRLGRLHRHLPQPIKIRLSMNKGYWGKEIESHAFKTPFSVKTNNMPP